MSFWYRPDFYFPSCFRTVHVLRPQAGRGVGGVYQGTGGDPVHCQWRQVQASHADWGTGEARQFSAADKRPPTTGHSAYHPGPGKQLARHQAPGKLAFGQTDSQRFAHHSASRAQNVLTSGEAAQHQTQPPPAKIVISTDVREDQSTQAAEESAQISCKEGSFLIWRPVTALRFIGSLLMVSPPMGIY